MPDRRHDMSTPGNHFSNFLRDDIGRITVEDAVAAALFALVVLALLVQFGVSNVIDRVAHIIRQLFV